MLTVVDCASGVRFEVAYDANMTMGAYLRFVLAPALGLACDGDTVFAKIHTPELRVVFNNECRHRRMGELLKDGNDLMLTPWPIGDPSTIRSLRGNALTEKFISHSLVH